MAVFGLPFASNARRRRAALFSLTLALAFVGVVLVGNFPDRILAGDPAVYRERVVAILEGGWPYFDVPFEHLPVMLLPMLLAWWLGGWISQSYYVFVFATLMSLVTAGIAPLVDRVGDGAGVPSAGWRWVALTFPVMPLVVFRNDPVAVLLAVVALALLTAGRSGWWLAATGGALAKIWPAAIALSQIGRQRARSILVVVAGVIGLGISYLPGFAERRDAVGIHAETVVGALIGFVRTITDQSSEVLLTTAAYIPVSGWVIGANALIGLSVAVIGVRAVLRTNDRQGQLVALGAVVAGVILTSGLFSLQYVLWLTPFLALSRSRSTLLLGFVLALVTLVLAWTWREAALEQPWFYAGVTFRNALVLIIALMMARESTPSSTVVRGLLYPGRACLPSR